MAISRLSSGLMSNRCLQKGTIVLASGGLGDAPAVFRPHLEPIQMSTEMKEQLSRFGRLCVGDFSANPTILANSGD